MTGKIQAVVDLSIALTLSTWSVLTLAVQNSWGGPQSSEKRDWLAGAISDLLEATPDADVEYIEEFILQVMNDEFEVNVEDGSCGEIAAKILGLRKLISRGDFSLVDEMYTRWQENQKKGERAIDFQYVKGADDEEYTDWDSVDEEEDSTDEDVDTSQAQMIAKASKEKAKPLVDDDGFIEVMGKRRR